jgi:hypothetical protein
MKAHDQGKYLLSRATVAKSAKCAQDCLETVVRKADDLKLRSRVLYRPGEHQKQLGSKQKVCGRVT